uniref:Presenilin n=1 Tax=Ascaris lumbricoides TaxID=6252 RepID=A0A0M3I077_ASCLU
MTRTSGREPSTERTESASSANDIPMGSSDDVRIRNSRRSSSIPESFGVKTQFVQLLAAGTVGFFGDAICPMLALICSYTPSFTFQPATANFASRPYLPFKEEEQTGWDALWKSIIIAAMFVGLIIAATSLIVFAYFMKWYKVYLVMISALVSTMLLHLFPSWAVWTVLGALALWDVVAVLCPFGPLQILIKLSRERNEPIMPALIYSAGLIYMNTKGGGQETLALHSCRGDRISCTEKPGSSECERLLCDGKIQRAQPEENGEARPSGNSTHERQISSASSGRAGLSSENPQNTSGTQTSARSDNNPMPVNDNRRANSGRASRSEAIKLGLGDFIFYGVLIGKASEGGILATISCFTAILIGLCATLVFLFIYGRALPALPISIFMGISFYFATHFLIDPFCESVSMHQLILCSNNKKHRR